MKVLVSCYACSPYKGSEPGMGWNFIKCLSSKLELHVIVESKFEEDINRYLESHSEEKNNMHFYFVAKERHKKLRKLWPPSYYWFYNRWQKKVYFLAKKLDAQFNFDLIHQLNMVGYREPGYLWKLDKPLVWGPIGGFNITPWCMLSSMGVKGMLFYGLRNIINLWQMHTMVRVKKAMRHSVQLISATQDVKNTIAKLYDRSSVLIPEVGYYGDESTPFVFHRRMNQLKLCWSGIFTPRKSLQLLLKALALTNFAVELHVIGDGECHHRWRKLAQKLKLDNVVWYGWVDRSKSIEIMKSCDVLCITSLSDLTSTVLLEGLSYGLPVIALDHCGFSNIINEKCGIKIPIHSQSQVISDFAKAIDVLSADERYLEQLSIGANNRAKEFGWLEKSEQIYNIYSDVLKHETI